MAFLDKTTCDAKMVIHTNYEPYCNICQKIRDLIFWSCVVQPRTTVRLRLYFVWQTVDNRYLRIHLKPCGKWFNWPCKKTSCSECPDIKRPLFSVIWDKADFSFTDKLSGWKERLSRQSQLNVFGFTTQAQINQEKPENLKAKSYFSTHWRMHSEGLTPEASC